MAQRTRSKASTFPPVPARCVVTGGSGFVGQRLVEMLVERGAASVVSFDIAPKPLDALQDARVVYQQGDLTKLDDVLKACEVRMSRELPLAVPGRVLFFPSLWLLASRAQTACGTSQRWLGPTTSDRRTTT